MIRSAAITRRESSRFALVLVLLCVSLSATTSAVAENPNPFAANAIGNDLTGLSLEQLYNLDVVQLNVLGGHTHPAGQIMFGYDYMHMNMGDVYNGSNKISTSEVFAKGFSTAHINMDMDMQLFELMYAPSDRLTLMAMLPYKEMSMLHQQANGNRFTQHASGIGDLELMGLVTLLGDIRECCKQDGCNRLVLNLGMSIPTGSVNLADHKGGNPNLPKVQLEYPMQTGSGTFDLLPGLTYLGEKGRWCWGAQTIENIRLGQNSAGYTFGNVYRVSAWGSYGVTEWFAPSVRLIGKWWENVDGTDSRLDDNTTPEGRPYLQGGRRLDLLFGLNFYVPSGRLKGNRLMLEGGFPVYQNLDGPQLGASWMLSVGWNYAF